MKSIAHLLYLLRIKDRRIENLLNISEKSIRNPWKSWTSIENQLKINWKSIENQWESMQTNENQWKSVIIYGKSMRSQKSIEDLLKISWKSIENQLKIYWKSMEINNNLWKFVEIHENQWKLMEIYGIYGGIEEKSWGSKTQTVVGSYSPEGRAAQTPVGS